MDEVLKELAIIMGSQFEQKTQKAGAIYDFILGQPKEKQTELVEFLLTNFGAVEELPQELTGESMSDDTWELLSNALDGEIAAELAKGINKSLSTKDITSNLWVYIENLKTRDQKVYTLAAILYDNNYIPLLTEEERTGAVTMSEEEFKEVLQKLDAKLQLVIKIKRGGFNTWQEMAAALLYQLNQVVTPQEKAVLMAQALMPTQPKTGGQTDFPGIVEIPESKKDELQKLWRGKAVTIKKLMKTDVFSQSTEKAGAILSFVTAHEDQDFQIILMSQILAQAAEQAPIRSRIQMLAISAGPSGLNILGSSFNPHEALLAGLLTHRFEENCQTCEKRECPEHPEHGQQKEALPPQKAAKPGWLKRLLG